MVVTLPLPKQITEMWPKEMVSFLQWFAFWSFSGLLVIPWLMCVYQIVTNQLGRTKRIKQVLDDVSAPKVVIVMPVYNEEPDVLITAINSVVDCDYPPACIHVFLSFDGDEQNELYLRTIERLGVPLTLENYPKSIDVTYKNARITVSRFPHGGKRHCQKMTFRLIDRVYKEYLRRNDNLFILFIDSDCILDRVCLQNFVYDMELSPGNKRNMLAMTGVITSTTRKHSLITLLQDMEYIHGQLFERTVESGCGAVTCLPGALTMLRFSAFRRMAKYYFADKAEQAQDLFDFCKNHLGEDRWLTHLFMIGAKKRYQIQMCTSAFCKTEAVQTMRSLVKQRRRWFLGFITNEVCMLTDWRLWRRYPILVLIRFMQNTIRTTALLFFIIILALLTTTKRVEELPIGFIAISLGLNWLLMFYFGAKLRRFKIWLYPLMFVLNPFFNWYYMVYGIFTAGQRTWGGPRADAAAADAHTTAQQAIEKAEQAGDELNIVPESFIPAARERQELARAAKKGKGKDKEAAGDGSSTDDLKKPRPTPVPSTISSGPGATLLPPDKIIGRFAAPERTASGWFLHPNDSMASIAATARNGSYYNHPHYQQAYPGSYLSTADGNGITADPSELKPPSFLSHYRRDSIDSTISAQTGISMSMYMPQRVENIMGEEDRKKYELAMQAQAHDSYHSAFSASDHALHRWSEWTPLHGSGGVGTNGSGHGNGRDRSPQGRVYEVGSEPIDSLTPPSPIPPLNAAVGGTHGRSPLSRASWTRTSSVEDVEREIMGQQQQSRPGSSRSAKQR